MWRKHVKEENEGGECEGERRKGGKIKRDK